MSLFSRKLIAELKDEAIPLDIGPSTRFSPVSKQFRSTPG